MPLSDVQICNRALTWVRAKEIASLDEASDSGRLVRTYYAGSRDAVLEAYDWNCAAARASLVPDADPPLFGYARQFEWPTDCLAVRAVEGGDRSAWTVEGRKILTDLAAPLRIRYTRRITDPTLFPPTLADAISARLAADMVWKVTENASQAANVMALAERMLKTAKRRDARQGTPEPVAADLWIEERR